MTSKRQCGYVWGEHGEHYCDADEGECLLSPGLSLHGCECGDDIYEDTRPTSTPPPSTPVSGQGPT